jgi:hypothetical protein
MSPSTTAPEQGLTATRRATLAGLWTAITMTARSLAQGGAE